MQTRATVIAIATNPCLDCGTTTVNRTRNQVVRVVRPSKGVSSCAEALRMMPQGANCHCVNGGSFNAAGEPIGPVYPAAGYGVPSPAGSAHGKPFIDSFEVLVGSRNDGGLVTGRDISTCPTGLTGDDREIIPDSLISRPRTGACVSANGRVLSLTVTNAKGCSAAKFQKCLEYICPKNSRGVFLDGGHSTQYWRGKGGKNQSPPNFVSGSGPRRGKKNRDLLATWIVICDK